MSSRIVTARKAHRCEWCGGVIVAGERCVWRKYFADWQFVAAHQHVECFRAMQRPGALDFDDSFLPMDQPRGLTHWEYDEMLDQEIVNNQ